MGNVLVIPESLWSFPDLLMKNGNLLALCALRCPHTMGSWGGSCSFSLVVGAFCTLGGCRRGEPSSRRHKIQHRALEQRGIACPSPRALSKNTSSPRRVPPVPSIMGLLPSGWHKVPSAESPVATGPDWEQTGDVGRAGAVPVPPDGAARQPMLAGQTDGQRAGFVPMLIATGWGWSNHTRDEASLGSPSLGASGGCDGRRAGHHPAQEQHLAPERTRGDCSRLLTQPLCPQRAGQPHCCRGQEAAPALGWGSGAHPRGAPGTKAVL